MELEGARGRVAGTEQRDRPDHQIRLPSSRLRVRPRKSQSNQAGEALGFLDVCLKRFDHSEQSLAFWTSSVVSEPKSRLLGALTCAVTSFR